MTTDQHHLWLSGGDTATRTATLRRLTTPGSTFESHRDAVGAYGSVRHLLAAIVPGVFEQFPEVVDRHRFVLLYPLPALSEVIGDGPMTLTERMPFAERTRYFSNHYIRVVSHGIIDVLNDVGDRRHAAGLGPLTLGFDNAHAADTADQEFFALLLRRSLPHGPRVILATSDTDGMIPELREALHVHADPIGVEPVPAPGGLPHNLAGRHVTRDGAGDVPAEVAAYGTIPHADRTLLHDARAAELLARPGDPSLHATAICWHLERGGDPHGAGRRALRDLLDHAVDRGYSTGAADLGARGRALVDPVADPDDHYHFTAKRASALVAQGEVEAADALYRELLEVGTRPMTRMTAYYALAMLHTRFHTVRNHDLAMDLLGRARALAGAEPDPVERASLEVYEDNGMALVEMHRGDLARAYRLVDDGLRRLAEVLPSSSWQVHRTQLMHNRARVLVALGRYDDAEQAYGELIERDPYYADYRADRARLRHRQGELDLALADFDWALAFQPPFPELHLARARTRLAAGDVDGAVADLERAVDLEPDLEDAWVSLVEARADSGDLDSAAQAAAHGLSRHGASTALLCLRADLLVELGREGAADEALHIALQLDPVCVPALARRADRRWTAGRFEAARRDLDAAIDAVGNGDVALAADLRLNRSEVHQVLGDGDLAVADLEAAARLPGIDADVLADIEVRRGAVLAAAR